MEYVHGGDIYTYGEVLDFSDNVNHYGPSEEVLEAAKRSMDEVSLYPDSQCRRLRKRLAEKKSLPEEYFLFGNGAAELFFSVVLAEKPKKALLPIPALSEYEKEIKKVVKAINFQEAIEAVKENREPIEFKDLYPHAIRHTFCSRCFEKGMDAKVVQMLMGHQHYSTTIDIYTHVTETKFEEEIAKFGSVSEKQKVQKNKNSTQCA